MKSGKKFRSDNVEKETKETTTDKSRKKADKNEQSDELSIFSGGNTEDEKSLDDSLQTASESEKSSDDEIIEREQISAKCAIADKWHCCVSHNTYDTGLPQELEEGATIEVFWAQDLAWYRGEVRHMSRVRCGKTSTDIFEIFVEYNDVDKETIQDIEKHRWRMIYGHPGSPDSSLKLTQKCPLSIGST